MGYLVHVGVNVDFEGSENDMCKTCEVKDKGGREGGRDCWDCWDLQR